MTRGRIALAFLLLALSPASLLAQNATPPAEEDERPACARNHEPDQDAEPIELAAWQTLELIDARTGESFSVADYLGCAVFFETMATWCSNCRNQLNNVKAAFPELDPDRHIVIAVSVEADLAADVLARYAGEHGWDWRFAVVSVDMLQAIVDAFGRVAITPPSTPHLIVYPDGTHSDLITGYSNPEDIVTKMEEAAPVAADGTGA